MNVVLPPGRLVKAFLEIGPGSKMHCVLGYLTGKWGTVTIEVPSPSQNRLFIQ